jgi:hypothetical protein
MPPSAIPRLFGGYGRDSLLVGAASERGYLDGGRGNDVLRSKPRHGVVRGGPAYDRCRVYRTVKMYGCERILRWT